VNACDNVDVLLVEDNRADAELIIRALNKSTFFNRRFLVQDGAPSNQRRDLAECYRLGVNGYVTKPIQFPHLFEAVSRIGTYWLLANQVP
jgi:CheY-like chemotaxis protein